MRSILKRWIIIYFTVELTAEFNLQHLHLSVEISRDLIRDSPCNLELPNQSLLTCITIRCYCFHTDYAYDKNELIFVKQIHCVNQQINQPRS